MKSFRSLFFTMPAKGLFFLMLFAVSLLFSECNIGYFSLYSEDRESFINAITQVDSFNYETSYYFKNTVENTIEDVTELVFDYEEIFDGKLTSQEVLKHFASIGDSTFADIYQNLSKMNGLHFALVNHDKDKIYSDIKQINGAPAGSDIKKYFGGEGKNQLIVHSCHNPYFVTDNFIPFAEHIRSVAKKYEDSFDIYITFGTTQSFAETEKSCEQLHINMRNRIEKLNDTSLVCMAVIILIAATLLTVTGKQEPKGKTYPTVVNRLPNDLIVLLYGIVLVCEISLYRTTSLMLISHGNELNEFWFTHSKEFYITRMRFCIVVFIYAAVNLLCILKRQYKMGLLIKNSYIYSFYKTLKNRKKTKKNRKND